MQILSNYFYILFFFAVLGIKQGFAQARQALYHGATLSSFIYLLLSQYNIKFIHIILQQIQVLSLSCLSLGSFSFTQLLQKECQGEPWSYVEYLMAGEANERRKGQELNRVSMHLCMQMHNTPSNAVLVYVLLHTCE
jgi:hypothetical protein